MKLTHKEFNVTEWKLDRNVLNPNINPEIEYFTFPINEIITRQPIVDRVKKLFFTTITIEWSYEIINKSTSKRVLFYSASDSITGDYKSFDNEESEINKNIKESYQRFSERFDLLKIELGIKQSIPSFSQDEYNLLCLSIINLLKRP